MNRIEVMMQLKKSKKFASGSKETIHKFQENALKEIIRYAFTNSAFYRNKYKEAGITEQNIDTLPITAFPVTDKKEIMDHYDQILTDGNFGQNELLEFGESGESGLFKNKWHVVHSSGSTGVPRYFVYDEQAWNKVIISGLRCFAWGLSIREVLEICTNLRILYVGLNGDRFGSNMMVDEYAELLQSKMLKLTMNESTESWKEQVLAFSPNFIIGYPSALKVLADQLGADAREKISISRIVSCAEVLTPQSRKYLEEYFQADIINFYASSESLAMGAEINPESGIILSDDLNFIEVINGKMYLTNLYNYSQPLIRYEISDIIRFKEVDENHCGFSRCEVITGRLDDILWFTDSSGSKKFIHPTALEDFCIEGLTGYQFVQLSPYSFRVDYETTPDSDSESIGSELTSMIQNTLNQNELFFVEFEARPVSIIEPDPDTGKIRLCISI